MENFNKIIASVAEPNVRPLAKQRRPSGPISEHCRRES